MCIAIGQDLTERYANHTIGSYWQSVAEVWMTGVASLGVVSHRFLKF